LSLSLCHFAVESTQTDGNLYQATDQAAYDGAVLVSARNRALTEARAAAQDGTLDNAAAAAAVSAINKAAGKTAVFTYATDGKVAEVFAHQYQNGQYHQNLAARASLEDYPNRGRELIRNAQDYAWCGT